MSTILNAFGLNVLNNGHSEDAIHKACIERQKELFNYHFFDYDSPEVTDTIKEYPVLFERCLKADLISIFADLVRIRILNKHPDWLYLDTDVYPKNIPNKKGTAKNSFCVIYGDIGNESFYRNYKENIYDYCDRKYLEEHPQEVTDLEFVHFTRNNPKHNHYFKGHQDFIARSYEELIAIKNTSATKLKKKVFTDNPELKRYSCKEIAVHVISKEFLILYEEVYGKRAY